MCCSLAGIMPMLEALLKAGASPDVLNEEGQTPLHLAALLNRLEAGRDGPRLGRDWAEIGPRLGRDWAEIGPRLGRAGAWGCAEAEPGLCRGRAWIGLPPVRKVASLRARACERVVSMRLRQACQLLIDAGADMARVDRNGQTARFVHSSCSCSRTR